MIPLNLIGLDVGDVRVGVAVCRAGIVLPRDTFARSQGEAEKRILELVQELNPETIVVGMPYNDHGELTEQCLKIQQFCRRLARRTPVPIAFVDEYGSTAESTEMLAHTSRRARSGNRGGMIDAQSASIILQTFLRDTEKRPA